MKELKIDIPQGYEIDKDNSTFEKIVFKQINELPKSWVDLKKIKGYYVDSESDLRAIKTHKFFDYSYTNTFKTKEQAEASVALAQLSQLRDVYRRGWEPDWSVENERWCIVFGGTDFSVSARYFNSYYLSFQDQETAELFLENFRDLIEKAKPLMS